MVDFDAMSVMSEFVLDDIDGEEKESGADEEVESDNYTCGVTDRVESVEVVVMGMRGDRF